MVPDTSYKSYARKKIGLHTHEEASHTHTHARRKIFFFALLLVFFSSHSTLVPSSSFPERLVARPVRWGDEVCCIVARLLTLVGIIYHFVLPSTAAGKDLDIKVELQV